ncbi:LysR family transcriptional regulator [soil metagenome]
MLRYPTRETHYIYCFIDLSYDQRTMHSQFISLRQLRFFVVLAETSNFSRAAEQMAVSQPALSSAIRQIETLLGLRLFDRSTHRVTLTGAGQSLLPHAQRLLITADNAFRDIGDIANRDRTTVRLGAIPSAMPALANAVAQVEGEDGNLTFHLADGKSDTLIRDLRSGALDLAVCVAGPPEDGLVSTLLAEDDMMLVTPVGHPLSGADRLAWSKLGGYEIVHFAGGSIGELSRAAMLQNNLSPSKRYRVDQVDSLFGIVASGLALGVMPRLYTRGFARQQVALIPLIRPAIKRQVMLLWRTEMADEHPAAAKVARRLGELLPASLASYPTGEPEVSTSIS